MKLHVRYCATFGISREQMDTAEESQACTTYTRFVLDIGATQDLFALNVATAACLIGYRDIAVRLDREYKDGNAKNMYWKWIENYTGESYRNAYNDGRELLEKYAVKQSTSRIEELVGIFAKTTQVRS